MGDYIGETYGAYTGDTRSLDYGSFNPMETAIKLQRQGLSFLIFCPLQNATRGTDGAVRVQVLISSEQIRSLNPQRPLVWPSHEL